MGLDLTLLPIKTRDPEEAFARTMLEMERCTPFFNRVLGLESESAPKRLYTLLKRTTDGERYSLTTHDGYGEPLQMVEPWQLTGILDEAARRGDELYNHCFLRMELNRAAMQYLTCLKREHLQWRVVLYWD